MSALALIFNRDRARVEAALLERMLDVIADRSPDGVSKLLSGPLAVGLAWLHSNPEERDRDNPFYDEASGLLVAFEGRIDNREELRALLEAHDISLRGTGDAELMLCLYRVLGRAALARVLGDFALAVYDPRRHELLLARDPAGVRPLYYHANPRRFLAATEVAQLLADPRVPRDINESVAAELIEGLIFQRGETLFSSIRRLEPAHWLLVREDEVVSGRYFDLVPALMTDCQDDEAFSERFFELFSEAVKARTQSCRRVGFDLSGGLDSSSVVVTAAELLRNDGVASRSRLSSSVAPGLALREAAGAALETFSLEFDEPQADERKYIAEVAQKVGAKSNLVPPTLVDGDILMAQARRYRDIPDLPNGMMTLAMRRLAVKNGCRVILTGVGGDQRLWGSDFALADLLRAFEVRKLFGVLKAMVKQNGAKVGLRRALSLLLKYGLRPLVPEALKKPVRMTRRERPSRPWLSDDLFRRADLAERKRAAFEVPRNMSFAQAANRWNLIDPWTIYALEREERFHAVQSLELRHPFMDRRLIEFCFAIPEDQRCRNGVMKHVLRNAMRGRLPESVRTRGDKGDFSIVYFHALRRLGWLPADAMVVQLGWVNHAQYLNALQDCLRSGRGDLAIALWQTVALEVWLKSEFGGSVSAG